MKIRSTFCAYCLTYTAAMILAITYLAICARAYAQCEGLHAGITAELVPLKDGFTNPAHVQLLFLLINDAASTIDVAADSWRIVIDGVELPDSDYIFGNGPTPTGGWKFLQPGQFYELGESLPIDKYFSRPGDHTVSWKGKGFRSTTVKIKVPEFGRSN